MESRLIRIVLAFASSLLLVSCASSYHSFYSPIPDATPEAIATRRASPPPAIPILERSAPDDPATVLAAYNKRGYFVIGTSMFNSDTNESDASALDQGKSVGADLVLVLDPKYTGSVTTALPITTPTSTTSNTTGSATAYGTGGSITAYGNSTTTTYGSNTTYIPMTTNRFNYGAVYFVKSRIIFGATTRDLDDTERQELQTNQGAVVLTVVDNSPAFNADILPGDIISTIDEIRVPNKEGLSRMIGERKGKEVTVAIVRRGKRIDKNIQLND